MNTNYVIGIVVVVVLAIGGYFLFMQPAAPAPVPTTDTGTTDTNAPAAGSGQNPTTGDSGPTSGTGGTGTSGPIAKSFTITYDGTNFSPKTVNVKVGDIVTWVNKSNQPMWVASNPHPLHSGYDGTTEQTHCAPGYAGPAPLDECGGKPTFTFTFTKVGIWGYHNHEGAEDGGTVVVTQ